MRALLTALLASLALAAPAAAQEPVRADGAPQVSTFTTGLAHPWELAFLPDRRALVTERGGRVRLLARDGSIAGTALELSAGGGEGGTLGLALDPAFAENRLVYLYRTLPDQSANQVLRFTFDGARLVEPALVVGGIPAGTIHDGGRLRFGPDAFLYVSTGDAGTPSLAQDPDSLAGKILRVPPAGYRGDGDGLEVVSLGHRNPQGFDWQPGTGTLYEDEHGPQDDDEINLIVPGGNYGWPEAVGPDHPPPFRSPLVTYTPSLAPSGATFVRQGGSAWTGDYLVAGLAGQRIQRLRFDGRRVLVDEELFRGEFGRLRDVVEGPDGALYVLTGNGEDRILRIVPPATPPAPPAAPPGGQPLTRLQRTTTVTAHGGVAAWSAFDPAVGGYRLVVQLPGRAPAPAPVDPRPVHFDVDLGPDGDGGVDAVYSRCRQEPDRHSRAAKLVWAAGRGCDLFRLDLSAGRETAVEGASTDQASETLPTLWKDAIGFARVYERRDGRRGDVPYLYVRPLDGGASQRRPGGARGSTGLPGPTSLDLFGDRLVFAWDWRDGDRLRSELRLTTPDDHELLDRVGSRAAPASFLTPQVGARDRLYAGLRRVRGGGAGFQLLVRARVTGEGLARLPLELPATARSVATDGDRLLAAVAADPLAAPACGEGGCAVVERALAR